MSVALIIQLIEVLSAVVQEGTKLYNDAENTMSLQDAAAIKAALQKAQDVTVLLRAQVDAALDVAKNQ